MFVMNEHMTVLYETGAEFYSIMSVIKFDHVILFCLSSEYGYKVLIISGSGSQSRTLLILKPKTRT
jgi:hypothetical protein